MHEHNDFGSSCTNLVAPNFQRNDYLHPKYSLPPINIDVSQHLVSFSPLFNMTFKISNNCKQSLRQKKEHIGFWNTIKLEKYVFANSRHENGVLGYDIYGLELR